MAGSWTPEHIPELTGKVFLITGGNTGLGKESIKRLANHKPEHIFLAARTSSKAEAAIEEIKSTSPDAAITFLPLDLTSFDSIKNAADEFKSKSSRLDVLMNNAGIAGVPSGWTKEGYEIQFGTNYVGHALLTKLLLPTMLKTIEEYGSSVRIINISSEGHNAVPLGGIILDQAWLQWYPSWIRYANSKLANILFTKALAKRYPQIISVSLHPGIILTNLYTPSYRYFIMWIGISAMSILMTTLEKGAYNQLWAATAPKEKIQNGGYYRPVGVLANGSFLTGYASNEKMSEKLWNWTEEELKKHGF